MQEIFIEELRMHWASLDVFPNMNFCHFKIQYLHRMTLPNAKE